MTNLVIQSYGRESEYKRAILAILSFYAHTSLLADHTKVILFTDNPEYFKNYFADLPVAFSLLTPAKIQQMRGKSDFLHRMKIALIEEAFNTTEGPVLYFDSDTFFIDDPTPLLMQVNEHKSFMHTPEYPFNNMPGSSSVNEVKSFIKLLDRSNITLSTGAHINISPDIYSWNAGVMILPEQVALLLNDVYALTDQFFAGSGNYASEQYAFSIMLQKNTLVEACEETIYHYWPKVKKEITDNFLTQHLNEQWGFLPLAEKKKEVKVWAKSLPDLFENHALALKNKAIIALGDKRYAEGYKLAMKAIMKEPFKNLPFMKDVLYYMKKQILHNER